ncbi:unnamed protein product [Victoria cruziana]
MEVGECSVKQNQDNDGLSVEAENIRLVDETVDIRMHGKNVGLEMDQEEEDLDTGENDEDKNFDKDVDGNADCFCPDVPLELKPQIGMTFGAEKDAYVFYSTYAGSAGFSIRKNHLKKKRGEVYFRQFTCSKNGLKRVKSVEGKKMQTGRRCGCLADMRISINKNTNMWVVANWKEHHNHPLRNADQEKSPPSSSAVTEENRIPTEFPKKEHQASSEVLKRSRKRTPQMMPILSLEEKGTIDLPFTENQVHAQSSKKVNSFVGKDYEAMIDYFTKKKNEHQGFYANIQIDDSGQFGNCFWIDDVARHDYYCFGDVLLFDTTSAKKMEYMPCVPFIGINNHWQEINFGFILLVSDTVESFEWAFKEWLSVMDGNPPKVIITNQDWAMKAAIARVFPGSKHKYCAWHVAESFHDKLEDTVRVHASFKNTWNDCVYGSVNVSDFEQSWENMLNMYPELKTMEWMQDYWDDRTKWVQVYFGDAFMAGLHWTQHADGTDGIIEKSIDRDTPLNEFFEIIEKIVLRVRASENELSHKMDEDMPNSLTNCPLETDLMKILTWKSFQKFQVEIQNSLKCVPKVEKVSGGRKYVLIDFSENIIKEYALIFDEKSREISKCACCKWELEGIVCRHIFWVLRIEGFKKLPTKYILKRWTRNAKDCLRFHYVGDQGRLQDSKIFWQNHLSVYAIKCILVGTKSGSSYTHVLEGLKRLSCEAEELNKIEELKSSDKELIGVSIEPAHDVAGSSNEFTMTDHQPIHTKGRGKRLTSEAELSKPVRRCATCGKPGHDTRNCSFSVSSGSLSTNVALNKPPRACKHCKGSGHDKRNCPKIRRIVIVEDETRFSDVKDNWI